MKKNIISIISGVFCIGVLFLASCTKQDHFYKEFMIDRIYIGKPDSIWIQPGEYRMQIGWLTPQDSEAKDLILRWSSTDSLVIAIDPDTEEQSVIIEDLEERDYSFTAYTTDRKGHTSLMMELNAPVFGDEYRSTIQQERVLSHTVVFPRDSIGFVFNTLGQLETLYGTEIEYTDNSGERQTAMARSTSAIGLIYDADPDQPITARTAYLPHPNGFEYFYFEDTPVSIDLAETKRNVLTFNVGGYLDARYIDFNFVRDFIMRDVPRPTGNNIDLCYALGGGSRGNFFTINSGSFSVFAAAWLSQIAQWPYRNTGAMKLSSVAVFDALDENNRTQMVDAFHDPNPGTATRYANLDVDDVVLLYSEERDIYVAMKVLTTRDIPGGYGDFTVEVKISRPE